MTSKYNGDINLACTRDFLEHISRFWLFHFRFSVSFQATHLPSTDLIVFRGETCEKNDNSRRRRALRHGNWTIRRHGVRLQSGTTT